MKKALRETQTLPDGAKNFRPAADPIPGGRDGHYLYLQTQFGEDRCTQFRVIVVTDPQTNKHIHPQTHRQDQLQYTVPQPSAQCKYMQTTVYFWFCCFSNLSSFNSNFRVGSLSGDLSREPILHGDHFSVCIKFPTFPDAYKLHLCMVAVQTARNTNKNKTAELIQQHWSTY